jgi:hypothetical protein
MRRQNSQRLVARTIGFTSATEGKMKELICHESISLKEGMTDGAGFCLSKVPLAQRGGGSTK